MNSDKENYESVLSSIRKSVEESLSSVGAIERHRKIPDLSERRGMTDAESRRLEDKINHIDEMGKARLDKAMSDINGKISLILERTDGIKADISASRASEAQHFQWLAGLMVASVLATILAIGGFAYSAKSLWAGGFSSGQSDRAQVVAPASPPSSH